jgi:hypothetical protein
MFPKQISVTSLAVIANINATSHQNALYALDPIIWSQHPQESPRRCVSDSGAI